MSKKISELPQYVGEPMPTGDIPISIGATTYRIDPSLLFVENPNPNPDTVINLIPNNTKEFLNIMNEDINGGFINYVLTDANNNIRTGTIRFSTSISGQYSFYEDIINNVGNTSFYTFSMTNNGDVTRLLFFSNTSTQAVVTFQKKLMINPN